MRDALSSPPPKDSRFKLIYSYDDNNAWILHNAFREKEIKNKLFACKQLKTENIELKKLALDVKPEVKNVLFENNAWVIGGFAISLSVGLVLGIMAAK